MDDKELERGYWLAYENAKALLNEASVLKANGHFARAYTLFQFATEECGKAALIYGAILKFYEGVEINKDYIEKSGFSDHKSKMRTAIGMQFAIEILFHKVSKDRQEALQRTIKEQGEVYLSNNLKNNSLYVHIDKNKFIAPKEVVTKELLEKVESSAHLLLEIAKVVFVSLEDTKRASDYVLNNSEKMEKWLAESFNDSVK